MTDQRVEMRLLGRFAVTAEGRELEVPARWREVMAYLGLHGTVRRDTVAWTLWRDRREERALAVPAHRPVALAAGLQSQPLVVAGAGALGLSGRHLPRCRDIVRTALAFLDAGEVVPTPSELKWWTLDLLPDWYDDWLIVERERYRQLRFHALEALSEQAACCGRFADAIELALQVVAARSATRDRTPVHRARPTSPKATAPRRGRRSPPTCPSSRVPICRDRLSGDGR